MTDWNDFEIGAPELAARARALIHRSGAGEGLLSTVAGDGLPRTHPVNVGIVDGRLLTFVRSASAKARDLAADGRYALHAHVDPTEPRELLLRGRAALVIDAELRARAADGWAFTPTDDYALYALHVEHALLGERADPDAWPPRYASWRATRVASML